MDSNLVRRVRGSDNTNWSYKMDSQAFIKSEQRNRLQNMEFKKIQKQFELERSLTKVEISRAQKSMHARMSRLQSRMDECQARYKVRKKLYDEECQKRARNSHPSLPSVRENTVQRMGHNAYRMTPGSDDMKRSQTDLNIGQGQPHYVVSQKQNYSPTVVPKAGRLGKKPNFLDRAMTDLDRLEVRHVREFDRNMKKLKQLERDTGVNLAHSPRVQRELWKPPPTPSARPPSPVDYIDILAAANRSKKDGHLSKSTGSLLNREGKKLRRRTHPQPGDSTEHAQKKPLIRHRSQILPFITKLMRESTQENSKSTIEESVGEGHAVSSQRLPLPLINIGAMPNKYIREMAAESNPFLADMPLPKTIRKRDLVNAAKDNEMYIWLGYKTKDDFVKALRESRNAQKSSRQRTTRVGDQSEVDVLEKLSEVSSSEESEDDDDEDERFQVFNTKKIKENDKLNGQNGPERKSSDAERRMKAALKAVLAITYFKMLNPEATYGGTKKK